MCDVGEERLDRVDADLKQLNDRLIRVEVKVDDAQEMREHAREQMSSLNSRMTWILGLIITLLLTVGPTVGILTYQVTQLVQDVQKNQTAISQRFERRTNELERKVDETQKQVDEAAEGQTD